MKYALILMICSGQQPNLPTTPAPMPQRKPMPVPDAAPPAPGRGHVHPPGQEHDDYLPAPAPGQTRSYGASEQAVPLLPHPQDQRPSAIGSPPSSPMTVPPHMTGGHCSNGQCSTGNGGQYAIGAFVQGAPGGQCNTCNTCCDPCDECPPPCQDSCHGCSRCGWRDGLFFSCWRRNWICRRRACYDPCLRKRYAAKYCGTPGDMYPESPYPPQCHGYYYFRPYNHQHIAQHQQIAARWGADARAPYRHDEFEALYDRLGMTPGPLPDTTDELPEEDTRPSDHFKPVRFRR